MDKTMMFVQRENISQTLASLQKEESPSERSLLKRILVEEETNMDFIQRSLIWPIGTFEMLKTTLLA